MGYSLIVAMDKNNIIGSNNGLPWHNSADLRHVKNTTMGSPLIMGRKCYESIGKPLPNRTNIILTRDTSYKADGCIIFNDMEELMKEHPPSRNTFIFGGNEIYGLFLPYVDVIYKTTILGEYTGDTYFPEIDYLEWELLNERWELEEKCIFSIFRKIPTS